MIAIDTNVLVYAHRADSPWNARAHPALLDLIAAGVPWGIPWHCLCELYAVVTHPRIFRPPSTHEQAIRQIESWLECPSLVVLHEDVGTWEVLRELVAAGQIAGPAVHDARIAAVCLQHGVSELWSCDRDFSRFPSLHVRNPLVDPLPTRAGERRAAYQLGKQVAGKRRTSSRSRPSP
jgi:hypothetical protein